MSQLPHASSGGPVRLKEVTWLHPGAAQSASAGAASVLSPLAMEAIHTQGHMLWLAPCSEPAATPLRNLGVGMMLADATREDRLRLLSQHRPRMVVAGDAPVDAAFVQQWRKACPDGELTLLRRGISLDQFDLEACRQHGVRVMNLPGVNASHVAGYMLARLRDAEGRLPDDVRLLGLGHVGQSFLAQLREANPQAQVTALVRPGKLAQMQSRITDPGLRLVGDVNAAFDGAQHVAVCLSVTPDSVGLVSDAHIAQMQPDARVVCVSKPVLFSDAALQALRSRSDARLVVDYGRQTIRDFQQRLQGLDIPTGQWGAGLSLTTQAAASAACAQDLDAAVVRKLGRESLDAFISQQLADPSFSLRIPARPPMADAPRVYVIGRGINGLFHALVLSQRGFRVQVIGQADGASHLANMRFASRTETTAKAVSNPSLFQLNDELVTTTNVAGMELLKQFRRDNPEFDRHFSDGAVRAIPAGSALGKQALARQTQAHERQWLRARPPTTITELPPGALKGKIAQVDKVFAGDGVSVAMLDLMGDLTQRLQRAGVTFRDERLSEQDIQALEETGFVITAMGAQDCNIRPVRGWFVRLRAVGQEGECPLKLHYPMPLDVLNVRRDGDDLLVSGGLAMPELSEAELGQVQARLLDAVQTHFPQSFAEATRRGDLEIIECTRPGTQDGLSRVEWRGYRRLQCGATYAGGFTQGLVLPLLAAHMLQERLKVTEL